MNIISHYETRKLLLCKQLTGKITFLPMQRIISLFIPVIWGTNSCCPWELNTITFLILSPDMLCKLLEERHTREGHLPLGGPSSLPLFTERDLPHRVILSLSALVQLFYVIFSVLEFEYDIYKVFLNLFLVTTIICLMF